MEQENNQTRSREAQVGPGKQKRFFIDHLDRIYCAKSHMVESFPGIAGQAHFSDLYYAIMETVDDVRKQIRRMDNIYQLLGTKCSTTSCTGLIGMLEETLSVINDLSDDVQLRDMAILFYLQNIESIEMASFQVLQIVAKNFNNPEISQLLTENFDEAKDDRGLLLMITEKYVSS